MAHWLTVISSLVILASLPLLAIGEWHEHTGPWVPATKGEVWPRPYHRVLQKEYFTLHPDDFEFKILEESCDVLATAVQRYLRIIEKDSAVAEIEWGTKSKNDIVNDVFHKGKLTRMLIRLKRPCEKIPHMEMNETYTLEIQESEIQATLTADSIWGILRGLETFSQLVTSSGNGANLKVSCQHIVDKPKFPHRGLMLDTSRHFFPVSDILLTLDAMAYNKLNVFHWHIVDDNSFPYESSIFPELSAKGAYHSTMIYTPGDIAAVIEYARLRGIRVLPEFDTPGHTKSWGLAYPDLLTTCYDTAKKQPNGLFGPMNPTNPKVYKFLQDLFTEVHQRFPDEYIHLGGDEVLFNCWSSNPEIMEFMQKNNMSKNFVQLEEFFIRQVLDLTASLKMKSIVWQEVFTNGVKMHPNTIVHVWTGVWPLEVYKAIRAGYPVVLSACWYLSDLAPGGDWIKYYKCDPLKLPGTREQKALILGGEACMWGEYVDTNNVHQRIWPRASAVAERLWSNEVEDPKIAAHRLEEHACRMNRRGIPAQPPNGAGFCIF